MSAKGERTRLLGTHTETSIDVRPGRSTSTPPRGQPVRPVHVQDDGNIWSAHHSTTSGCCSCSFSWPIASGCGCIVLILFMLAPVPGTIPTGAVALTYTKEYRLNTTIEECDKIFNSLHRILGPFLLAFGSFYAVCWLPVLCLSYRILNCQPHDCRDCYCRMHTAVVLALFCLSVIGFPVVLILTVREFVQESLIECLPISVLLVAISIIVFIITLLQILSLLCLSRKRQQVPWDLAHNYQDGVYV